MKKLSTYGCRLSVVGLFIAFLAYAPIATAAEYQNTFFGSGEACSASSPCKKGEVCDTSTNTCVSATTDFFGAFGVTQAGGGTDMEKYGPMRFWVNAINMLLGFLGIFSVAIIVYGGFKFMTAGGEADKAKSAAKTISYAALGLVVIALAWLIGAVAINTLIDMLK